MVNLFSKNVLKICLVLILLFLFFCNVTFALAGSSTSSFDVKGTFNGKINNRAINSSNELRNVFVDILTVVRIVGMAIAIIVLIVIGIKIMVASPSEKANIKQYSINYVIGAFFLLGGYGILTIVQKVVSSAFTP